MKRPSARYALAVLLLLAGCGGEEAAPARETPAEESPAPPRPQISVETPVRSPGTPAEAGPEREDAAAVEIPPPNQPEPPPDPDPEPDPEPVPPTPAEPPPTREAAAAPAAEPAALLAVLPVRDVDAAVAFYRDGLGFTRGQDGISGEVVLERGPTRLALRRTEEGVAPRAGASGWNVPRSGLVLRLEVDDVEAVRERLSAAGLAPRRARGGGLAVLDPAGHLVVVSGS